MNTKHNEIISQPHHRSRTRMPMPMQKRAAQFAPFAALSGYESVIRETARLTQAQTELAEDRKEELDRCLRSLQEGQTVTVTFFKPDKYKTGGALCTVCGTLKCIDPTFRRLCLTDGTQVFLDAITDVSGG